MSATDARDVSTPAGVAAGEHRPAQLGRRVATGCEGVREHRQDRTVPLGADAATT